MPLRFCDSFDISDYLSPTGQPMQVQTNRSRVRTHHLITLLDPKNLIGLDVFDGLDGTRRPTDLQLIDGFGGTQAEVHRAGAARSVTGSRRNVVVLEFAVHRGADPGTDAIAIAFRAL